MTELGNITFSENIAYLEFREAAPYYSVFAPGAYYLEVWGAQGGAPEGNDGGKGGYSRGIIFLRKYTKIYINVGEKGHCTSLYEREVRGSFNGGGPGKTSETDGIYRACSGGGATDVRIRKNDVYHRVIVAGAGGGFGNHSNKLMNGGFGGGLEGGNGEIWNSDCGRSSKPGTQYEYGHGVCDISNGTFGQGGSAFSWDGGGGGGGWYGGSAGQGCIDAGGGGSGFVLTPQTYQYAKKIPYYALNKNYFLSNAKTFGGNETQKGNLGNGKAKITLLISVSMPTCSIVRQYKIFALTFVFIVSK